MSISMASPRPSIRPVSWRMDSPRLSPACAAFDQFKNFMERGKTFKAIVNGWRE